MSIQRPRHPLRWVVGGIVVLAVLAVGGPFLYIHFFNGSTPAALSLPTGSATSATSPSASAANSTGVATSASTGTSVAGAWRTTTGSVVGYRVNEVLLGQNATAVGRSSQVTGHLTIAGTSVTAASFTVPMSTIHSDKSQRDAQFDGRIMNVSQYPTGTFALSQPIDLAPLPATGAVKDYTAHGNLSLHGTTKPVTFTLQAELKNGQIDITGQIPVLFSDYNIQNPSFAGFVTTQDHGILEFLLVLSKS